MFSVGLSEVTTTQSTGRSHSTATTAITQRQRGPPRRAGAAGGGSRWPGRDESRGAVPGSEASHQYSVWPRSRRNWSSEKPRMIMNSTQAIAVAEPKWKKFRKAVS